MNYIWNKLISFHRALSTQLQNFDALCPYTDGQSGGKRACIFLVLCSLASMLGWLTCLTAVALPASIGIHSSFKGWDSGNIEGNLHTWGSSKIQVQITPKPFEIPYIESINCTFFFLSIIYTNQPNKYGENVVSFSFFPLHPRLMIQHPVLEYFESENKTSCWQLGKGRIRDRHNSSDKSQRTHGAFAV